MPVEIGGAEVEIAGEEELDDNSYGTAFVYQSQDLHDGHDDGDGVFGILPRKSCNRHAAVLLSEAARRRIAGRKTCHKGVQRERLAHGSLQGKV